MPDDHQSHAPGGKSPRRLYVYNGGFLTQKRIRRILELSGWSVSIGKPGSGDWVGVWGKSPTSPRGEAVAERTDAPILHVEDAFLRSVHPGRSKEPPLGLCFDESGLHFDSATPSDLETLLATHPLDDTALLNRARSGAERLRHAHLSKYNAFDPNAALPEAPYVLVLDQTKGDASIEFGAANAASFAEMLVFAQTEHPGSRVVIKSHPEDIEGHRPGHFGPDFASDRVSVLTDPVSPWALMEGATAVYTVSSQLGFEAIYAGHKPRVFGQPFYAGWGLTQDENPVARRERTLTRAQLFAATMILYPKWYDPYRDTLCEFEVAVDALEAQTRAWREDHGGYTAHGMSRWKHAHLNQFFGQSTPLEFSSKPIELGTAPSEPRIMTWGTGPTAASDGTDAQITRVEDGFLRSNGLGARLTPPISLITDDLGIYYDPRRESRLEQLINQSATLTLEKRDRADRLLARIKSAGLSKYNPASVSLPELPEGHRILVPGQVEDDQSIVTGCSDIRTNLDLLARTRQENPNAVILFKPHPDVEAGLRAGAVTKTAALEFADQVLAGGDPIALIEAVNEVWTMTSTLGFEALIRGVAVTCAGMPFYAGWGLTTDIVPGPARRAAKPDIPALVHACLIDYPRYLDPVTGLACPPEVALERLKNGVALPPKSLARLLGTLQNRLGFLRRR